MIFFVIMYLNSNFGSNKILKNKIYTTITDDHGKLVTCTIVKKN